MRTFVIDRVIGVVELYDFTVSHVFTLDLPHPAEDFGNEFTFDDV